MKRKVCLFLALTLMILCCLPITAFAEGTDRAPGTSPTETPAAATVSPSPLAAKTATPTSEPTEPATDPTEPPVQSPGQLSIDSNGIYPGMDKTYADGYIPTVKDGKVTLVLPLIGKTKTGEVNLTADLGATMDSPFVFGNYSQTAKGDPYVFTLTIPLASGRINGSYPVTLNASYVDSTGALATQSFILYVTIKDGKKPVDPNAPVTPEKETIDKPELFISSCVIKPNTVGANQEFSVDLKVENIGTLRARSVRLTYGSSAAGGEEGGAGTPGILSVETNNSIHLENIASGKSQSVTFKLKTTKDVLAGNQPFSVTLDYTDAYGGVYTASRQFLVTVTQPAEISYDPIVAPKTIVAGETFTLPANVFNVGKSPLRNVTITVTGAGLFPTSSVFLGDIAPGGTGNGEMNVFAGMLSMTEGYTEDYGKTNGLYTITYTDDAGEEHKIEIEFTTEITKPVIEGEDEETELTEEPAFQWWVTILVGLAIISILVAVIVVTKVTRAAKMK